MVSAPAVRGGPGSGGSVAALPKPFLVAHRGMANLFPENTLEAFKSSAALGIDVIETDCWLTSDASLVCVHDATIDRTTTGSGPTSALTERSTAALRVDAGAWFAAAWPNNLRVPSFTDVLDQMGGRVVLCIEAKNNGVGRAVADRLRRNDLLDAAIVQSFIGTELVPVVAAGGHAMMLTATAAYDAARIRAAGIRLLGLSAALPTALVPSARALGLDVIAWVIDRRVDASPWLSAGAVGLFSNDPLYLAGRSPVLTSDPFEQQTFFHGHLASAVANDRGTFTAGTWGYADTSWSYKGTLQGWASPISYATGKGSVSIAYTVRLTAASTSSAWAGAFVCAADDRSFDDVDDDHPGLCGYHIRLRRSGELELHVVADGVARLAASSATPAIAPGSAAAVRIDITRTQVAATRLDAARQTTIAVTHGSYRGGYVHLGRRGAAVRFSNVIIG